MNTYEQLLQHGVRVSHTATYDDESVTHTNELDSVFPTAKYVDALFEHAETSPRVFEQLDWADAATRGSGPSAEAMLGRTFAELWSASDHDGVAGRVSALFDLAPIALLEIDASASILRANPCAQRLLGCGSVGEPVNELGIDAHACERILHVGRAARLHRRALITIELGGRAYQVEALSSARSANVLLYLIDAEHVLIHGESERSARALRAILRAAREGVALLADERVLYANDAWEKLTASADAAFLREVVEGKSLALRLSELADGDSGQTIDVRLGQGTSREVLAELTSVFVEYQGRRCVLVMARDLTARRRLEARVARSERLASLGMLVAGVAHEINNPLTYALGNLESLEARVEARTGALSDDDAREALRDAIDGCKRIATIIRELRSFYRADESEIVLVDPNQVIRDAARIVAPKCVSVARLEMELAEVPPVLGIPTSLVQVLINLIVNAVDAMPQRSPDANRVRISSGSRGNDVRIEIADNGRGIAPEDLAHIFEPFFSRGKSGGTGLGLTISRNLVEQLNGWIDVDSRAGVGTRFIIHLQAAESQVPERWTDPPQPSPALLSGLRILVVDDEPLVARSVARLLGQAHEVLCAHSVGGALDLLSMHEHIDVVISDWVMPDGGAQALVRHMAHRGYQDVPVVVMTGLGQIGGREPVDGPCVRKPVSQKALLGAIADALAARQRSSMVVRTDSSETRDSGFGSHESVGRAGS
jgi:signal transduction histidine kinase